MRTFAITLFFCWIITLFLPWWGITVPCVIIGVWLFQSRSNALLIGFFSAGFAWFLQVFYIDVANQSILSSRIAEMMGVSSHWIILFATFFIAGVLGAVSALFGYSLKTIIKPDHQATVV